MTVTIMLHGSEVWSLMKNNTNRTQSADKQFFRKVNGCTKFDIYTRKNEDNIGNTNLFPIRGKIK